MSALYHLVDLRAHGYWVPLTVLFVLRPEPDETIERIAMRAAGHPRRAGACDPARHARLAGSTSWRPSRSRSPLPSPSPCSAIEYALFTAAITTFIILLAHALGQDAEQAAGQRAVATLIGLGIVAMAVALWGGRRDST